MKLYYTKGACSLACRIVIHELGLECEYIAVDLKTKKTDQGQDFTRVNKKGAVPVLVTDDGITLTENAVIQQYLAEQNHAYELLPEVGNMKRYQVLEWLNYVATELHKGFSLFFNESFNQEIRQQILMPAMNKKLSYVDQSLQDKSFLMNEQFTLPDAYLFVMLTWARHFKFQLDEWTNVSRYFKMLEKRPSIHQSLQEEGLAVA
jgi:glutathione S-transferase